jgi:hypothetical protein
LVDVALLGGDALRGGAVGSLGGVGGRAVIGDGPGKGRLLTAIELLELAGLLAPVAGVALLDHEQQGEADRDREPGDALDVEQPQIHHALVSVMTASLEASMVAPERVAATLKRPTGPPARRPTITTVMAAMNPPSDQPKMTTMLCSSAAGQPPHIRSATMATAQAAQNIPAAAASKP